MWFKKKKKEIITKPSEMKGESFGAAIDGFKAKNRVCGEPVTLAALRLEGGANDVGASNALRMFNSHKTRLQNQWVNPAQSINSGYGTAQLATYFYQSVNYYECYTLAQDGLFQNIFNILSDTPYSKGGELAGEYSEEQKTDYENLFRDYRVFETAKAALRSSYVCGGCLVYMDFGLSEDELGRKLDLKCADMRKFKGFRRIDPINVVALNVNTVDPAKDDYMRPSKWYVIGLGVVDSSHFLHFEKNAPELIMRPLCMYFGFPLTSLIKNDVANASQASQGLANLMNRFRYLYLKTDITNIVTNPQAFKDRLEWMSLVQDNYAVAPIKNEEEISQLTTSLAGMSETVYMFYELVSARTGIPQSVLLGKGNQGLSGTLEGDRRNWYDNVRRLQSEEKPNLLKMMGIAAGTKTGKFVEFDDYVFAPLEEATEKELAENLRSFAEAARALIEMGAKPDGVLNWLKNFKQFSLDEVEFDADTEGLTDYEDITPEVYAEYKAENAWEESKHPRQKDGKFGSGEGGINSVSGKKSKDDFYGEEFKGVKGKEAIKKVIAEKRGHVKDAFTRKDIGGIDLVWGDEEGGLRHILEGRSNYGDLDDFVTSLSDVIENGSIIINQSGNFEIWFERKIAVVSPDYNGDDNIKFLITGFKQKKPNKGREYK